MLRFKGIGNQRGLKFEIFNDAFGKLPPTSLLFPLKKLGEGIVEDDAEREQLEGYLYRNRKRKEGLCVPQIPAAEWTTSFGL